MCGEGGGGGVGESQACILVSRMSIVWGMHTRLLKKHPQGMAKLECQTGNCMLSSGLSISKGSHLFGQNGKGFSQCIEICYRSSVMVPAVNKGANITVPIAAKMKLRKLKIPHFSCHD